MKTCTVLPSIPALITTSTAACSVIECHRVPSALEGALGYGTGSLLHTQPEGSALTGFALALEIVSPGPVENSALY